MKYVINDYTSWCADATMRETLAKPGVMTRYFKSIQHETNHAVGDIVDGYRVVLNIDGRLYGPFISRLNSNDYALYVESLQKPQCPTLWVNNKYKPTYKNRANMGAFYMFTDKNVCMAYMKAIAYKVFEKNQYKNITLEMYHVTGTYTVHENALSEVNVNEGVTIDNMIYGECIAQLDCAMAYNHKSSYRR